MQKHVYDCATGQEKLVDMSDAEVAEVKALQESAKETQRQIDRAHRNALLAASDWTQMPDAPVDAEAWRKYRQTLRDHPLDGSPWPDLPA